MMSDLKIARALYRKLLALYPHAFRERLGESMEQTFADLCNERQQQSEAGWLGFVAGLFVETAIGIGQEHILLIQEMHPMKNILSDLRLPASVSFILLLPFMLLDILFVIVKRQAAFSLRSALDLVVLFGFLWLGLTALLLILMPLVRTLRTGKAIQANPAPGRGNTVLTNPTSTAIISCLLALPFALILSFLVLGIEPPFAPVLNNPDPDQPNVLGTLIVLGAFLLAVLAGLVARAPIMRTLQAGGSLFAHPVNLMLAAIIFSLITLLVVGLIADQSPCWIGVPNCD